MSSDVRTCFGSEGAARIMRACHKVEEGLLEWWDESGEAVLSLNYFGGSRVVWEVRTPWGGFDETDRKTACLILRGLLAPDALETRLIMAEGRENGIIETNVKWMEKLRKAVCRRHSCCCAGETCNECMEELLREMGIES